MDSFNKTDFVREVDARFRVQDPSTFWECLPAIRSLLSGGGLTRWVNSTLSEVSTDPNYAGDWLPNEVVLHRGGTWLISVALLDTPRRYIHVLPFYAAYAPLGRAPIAYSRCRLPANYRNDVFDPGIRLEPPEAFAAKTGELIRLESDRFAYDFEVPEPAPILRFVSTTLRPLEWLFSKSTLQAWQANDGDLSFTQLRVAAYVLGKMAHHSSIEPLRQLAAHPHHSVRWAAIQNLGRLNRSEALLKIREAVSDPHPHVRRAAQKTLDQLERRARK